MKFFSDIYYKYFCVNLNDYDKIGIDLQINKLLLFVFIGLCVATVIISITQLNTALLLKKLLRTESFSSENAKTLENLGLDKNIVLKYILSKTTGKLFSVISFAGYKRPSYEEYVSYEKAKKAAKFKPKEANADFENTPIPSLKPDLATCSIYIEKSNVSAAEELFKHNSTSILKTVLSCALLLAFYVAIMFLMPGILSLVNTIIA